MSLEGRHLWLATRGGDRVPYYQSELVAALDAANVASVEVVGVEGLFRAAVRDLGGRAGEWLENAANRVARGLRVDRLLGRDPLGGQPADGELATGPDLIVLDDPSLVRALKLSPAVRRDQPMLVALIDDFKVDTGWRGASVNAFIVPHADLLPAYRTSDPRIQLKTAGPPLATTFAGLAEPAAARTAHGLPAGQPAIVVAAEHFGLDVLDRAVFQLTLIEPTPTVVFHYGANGEVAEVLREAAGAYGLVAQIVGELDDPAPVYAVADVILMAASDPAASDLLLARRPLVLIGRDRGAARSAFIVDQGGALRVEDAVELGTHLETLLQGNIGDAYVEAGRALAADDATRSVVTALGELWQTHEQALAQPTEPATEAPSGDQPLAVAPPKGPFESIGQPPLADGSQAATPQPITAAEAKDQMARLILKEREAERSLAEAARTRDRWLERLELAREYQDTELEQVAAGKLALARAEVARVNGQIETIHRAKDKLKARVGRDRAPTRWPGDKGGSDQAASGETSSYEARFRKMEIERDLSRLRKKLDPGTD